MNHPHCFTATLPQGTLGLMLPRQQPQAATTLDAGVALGQAESWLNALEHWLGCGLVPLLEPHGTGTLFKEHLVLHHPPTQAQVHLPWHLVAQAANPLSEALPQWSWQPLMSELTLGSVLIEKTDLLHLEPGALILIPASFEDPWCAHLQTAPAPPFFDAQLQRQKGQLQLHPQNTTSTLPAHHATLRARAPVTVMPNHLWPTAGPSLPSLPDTNTLLETNAVALYNHEHTPLASGQLIPIGRGFALRIQHMEGATWT